MRINRPGKKPGWGLSQFLCGLFCPIRPTGGGVDVMPYLDIPGTALFSDDRTRGGPPLVPLHGFTRTHEDWRFQATYFHSRQGVVSPDLRRHGLSFCRDPVTCIVKNCGTDVKALLDIPDITDGTLGGHSRGCGGVLQVNLWTPKQPEARMLLRGNCMATSISEAEPSGLASASRPGDMRPSRKQKFGLCSFPW
jgi:hypothetical protein